ncbi:MAG: SDR family NAD(P)-dependent oxidoreductase [Gammaproteobacteria bacterium]|nr:SDR family NAD(P)-dependent oxidoreductase [Gammaproteobacteria bacterium]
MTENSRLTDAILITGAGRRIGLHLAERLLAAGQPVIAHYHHETEGVEALRQRGVPCIAADLESLEGVNALIQRVREQAASLRGLVHNASSFEKTAADPELALAQFERFQAIHARAPYLLNKALAPLLRLSTAVRADIIHITDIYADKPNPAFDAYCASKAAAQNLALSFAQSLAPKIKVNVIQPGPILFKEWHSAAAREAVLEETLFKEEGGVEALGLAVESILANHYQTGAIIAVDGGRRLA